MSNGAFVPALRWRILTGAYDFIVALTTREARFKALLVRDLELSGGESVLDVGCGTGTLAIAIKARAPQAGVVAVDADDTVLAIAREKAREANVAIDFRECDARALPLEARSFDVVVSSLFFHHLRRADKERVLREICRVLRPGGVLHVADWGRPDSLSARLRFFCVRVFDGLEITRESAQGAFPALIRSAGFRPVRETHAVSAPLGTIRIWRAEKPAVE